MRCANRAAYAAVKAQSESTWNLSAMSNHPTNPALLYQALAALIVIAVITAGVLAVEVFGALMRKAQ
jgi:hypothetical protein